MGVIKKAAKNVAKKTAKKAAKPVKKKLRNAGRFITGADSKAGIKPW